MLGYCLHGLCAFPNIVIHENIAKKSEKWEEKNRHDVDCYCGNVAAVLTWSVHISKYGK